MSSTCLPTLNNTAFYLQGVAITTSNLFYDYFVTGTLPSAAGGKRVWSFLAQGFLTSASGSFILNYQQAQQRCPAIIITFAEPLNGTLIIHNQIFSAKKYMTFAESPTAPEITIGIRLPRSIVECYGAGPHPYYFSVDLDDGTSTLQLTYIGSTANPPWTTNTTSGFSISDSSGTCSGTCGVFTGYYSSSNPSTLNVSLDSTFTGYSITATNYSSTESPTFIVNNCSTSNACTAISSCFSVQAYPSNTYYPVQAGSSVTFTWCTSGTTFVAAATTPVFFYSTSGDQFLEIAPLPGVTTASSVSALVVGGGAGGDLVYYKDSKMFGGSGGGGGGFLSFTLNVSQNIFVYTKVGQGGVGAYSTNPSNGGSSAVYYYNDDFSIVSTVAGGGVATLTNVGGASGTPQSYPGYTPTSTTSGGSGGGGGGSGSKASSSFGGAGMTWNDCNTYGVGGTGGITNSYSSPYGAPQPTPGAPNTGNGGGGAALGGNGSDDWGVGGADGGSGVVGIQYDPTQISVSSLSIVSVTVTSSNNYQCTFQGSYTSSYVYYVVVGGGGGGSSSYNTGGGGGGGGQVSLGFFTLTDTQIISVVIGAGGTKNGGAGGASTIYYNTGSVITSNGGAGGTVNASGVGVGGTSGSGNGGATGSTAGGGGGGAGAAAATGSATGGLGVTTLQSITYGTGGNGGTSSSGGSAGAANTGNGGQGGEYSSTSYTFGGAGGTGFVELYYNPQKVQISVS